jgi:hypothetical protein
LIYINKIIFLKNKYFFTQILEREPEYPVSVAGLRAEFHHKLKRFLNKLCPSRA